MYNMNPKLRPMAHQPHSNSWLHRYVTIDKLFDFLLNGRIPLVRLDVFEDKLEGVNIKHLIINYLSGELGKNAPEWLGRMARQVAMNVNMKQRNSLREQRENFQKSNYSSGWYINKHESAAMWQIYSKPDSVNIRVNAKVLLDKINSGQYSLSCHNPQILKYGNISYYRFNDLEELLSIGGIERDIRGFTKDRCFEHEHEFRLMLELELDKHEKQKVNGVTLHEKVAEVNAAHDIKIVYLNFHDFSDIPFEITFHPTSTKWHRDNVTKLIESLSLKFKTKQSDLRDIFN